MGYVITVDGPAASGKSSLSRELSKKFRVPWVSTGAFYRGLGYAALQTGVDLNNPIALTELCHSDVWEIRLSFERTLVYFKNQDVTDAIAQEAVGNVASQISQYLEVRQSLLDNQRQFAVNNKGLIAEGRDCGTVVFPHAEAKIYLTAHSENRAQRRAQEQGLDQALLVEQQKIRDRQDSTRKVAPLAVPKNALVLDTSELDLLTVVNLAEKHIRSQIQSL